MGKRVSIRSKVRRSVAPPAQENRNKVTQNCSKLKLSSKVSFVGRSSLKFLTKRDKMIIRKRLWEVRLKRAENKLKQNKQVKKKLKSAPLFQSLNSLFEAIHEIETDQSNSHPKPPKIKVLTSKRRKKMLAQESERFRRVQLHPSFKADPMGAITEHLKNEMNQKLKTRNKIKT